MNQKTANPDQGNTSTQEGQRSAHENSQDNAQTLVTTQPSGLTATTGGGSGENNDDTVSQLTEVTTALARQKELAQGAIVAATGLGESLTAGKTKITEALGESHRIAQEAAVLRRSIGVFSDLAEDIARKGPQVKETADKAIAVLDYQQSVYTKMVETEAQLRQLVQARASNAGAHEAQALVNELTAESAVEATRHRYAELAKYREMAKKGGQDRRNFRLLAGSIAMGGLALQTALITQAGASLEDAFTRSVASTSAGAASFYMADKAKGTDKYIGLGLGAATIGFSALVAGWAFTSGVEKEASENLTQAKKELDDAKISLADAKEDYLNKEGGSLQSRLDDLASGLEDAKAELEKAEATLKEAIDEERKQRSLPIFNDKNGTKTDVGIAAVRSNDLDIITRKQPEELPVFEAIVARQDAQAEVEKLRTKIEDLEAGADSQEAKGLQDQLNALKDKAKNDDDIKKLQETYDSKKLAYDAQLAGEINFGWNNIEEFVGGGLPAAGSVFADMVSMLAAYRLLSDQKNHVHDSNARVSDVSLYNRPMAGEKSIHAATDLSAHFRQPGMLQPATQARFAEDDLVQTDAELKAGAEQDAFENTVIAVMAFHKIALENKIRARFTSPDGNVNETAIGYTIGLLNDRYDSELARVKHKDDPLGIETEANLVGEVIKDLKDAEEEAKRALEEANKPQEPQQQQQQEFHYYDWNSKNDYVAGQSPPFYPQHYSPNDKS